MHKFWSIKVDQRRGDCSCKFSCKLHSWPRLGLGYGTVARFSLARLRWNKNKTGLPIIHPCACLWTKSVFFSYAALGTCISGVCTFPKTTQRPRDIWNRCVCSLLIALWCCSLLAYDALCHSASMFFSATLYCSIQFAVWQYMIQLYDKALMLFSLCCPMAAYWPK